MRSSEQILEKKSVMPIKGVKIRALDGICLNMA